jgi:hypothetical protein
VDLATDGRPSPSAVVSQNRVVGTVCWVVAGAQVGDGQHLGSALLLLLLSQMLLLLLVLLLLLLLLQGRVAGSEARSAPADQLDGRGKTRPLA